MRPIVVSSPASLRRWLREIGVSLQPLLHFIVVVLLGPEHSRQGLTHHGLGIGGETFRNNRSVKLVGLAHTSVEDHIESLTEWPHTDCPQVDMSQT